MIFQPWSNGELQAITASAPLSTRQNVRGQVGGRIWNVTAWWWDIQGEGDPNRPQALVPPWSYVEFELESSDMLDVLVQTAVDLASQPLTSMVGWRLQFQFLDEAVTPQIMPLLQQLASTDTIKVQVAALPTGATPVTNSSGNVANATATATLPAAAGVFTWLSGFQLTGAGATGASVVLVTVTGVVGGTLTYALVVPAGATTSIVPLTPAFQPALRSSAVNTPIVVSATPFGAGNTNAAVTAQGYQA